MRWLVCSLGSAYWPCSATKAMQGTVLALMVVYSCVDAPEMSKV